MARMPNLEKLSYTDLIALRADIDGLILTKQGEEKSALKTKLAEMARAQGFELSDIVGDGRTMGKTVAVKYRDPNNPQNTWTGRGRSPLWLVEATKKRGVTREDFLV